MWYFFGVDEDVICKTTECFNFIFGKTKVGIVLCKKRKKVVGFQ